MTSDLRGDRPEPQPAEAPCPAGADHHQGRVSGEFHDRTSGAASNERRSNMYRGVAGVGPQLSRDQGLPASATCCGDPLGSGETRKRHVRPVDEQQWTATARGFPRAKAGRVLAALAPVDTHQDWVPVDAVGTAVHAPSVADPPLW